MKLKIGEQGISSWKSLLTSSLAALTLLMTACDHKELCYVHPHEVKLKVTFDWSYSPEAKPAGMVVFFYHEDYSSTPYRMDFEGREGGEISLIPGKYRVLTYNNDTETVRIGNTHDFDTHYAFTRDCHILEPIYGNGLPSPPRSEETEDERVVITPDMLWGDNEIDFIVTGTEDQTITLYPRELLCHYSYEVRNVKNLKHVSQMSGALSGMSPSMILTTEELHTEPVTHPFEAWRDGESTIRGEFYTFGHHTDVDKPHKMSFYLVMDDGSKYSYTNAPNLDVTEQVHSAPDRKRVHIIIDGLDLPTPIENGNGFKPEVDDWDDIQQDIEM